ncbi:MAG: radical SAM protein [Methanosarcinales archaeon]
MHLPFIEEVVKETKKLVKNLGVGIATNGFCTPNTLKRIIKIATSISFEIKAYDEEVNRALTGAPSEPILRNAEILIKNSKENIRVFRSVVIPRITDTQIPKIAEFIANLDPAIPYRLIGFRPNFILYYHPGPSEKNMEKLTSICRKLGLQDVSWSGYYPIEPKKHDLIKKADQYYSTPESRLAALYLLSAGCPTHPRSCGTCALRDKCPACLMEPWNLR